VHAPMSCFGALTTLPRDKWEWKWFSTVKGSDWLHLYMWMVKDLAWAQGWYAVGMISGAAALVWSAVLEYLALKEKNYVEAWHYMAQFLWLLGNFWWMWGDLHDTAYPKEVPLYAEAKSQSAVVLIAAMAFLTFNYAVLRPFKLLPPAPDHSAQRYNDSEVKPPPHLHLLFLFPTWRQYEHVHILLWLGKDLALALLAPVPWCAASALTLAVAADFAATTSSYPGMAVDHAHYVAQLLWVVASAAWAFDELLLRGGDTDTDVAPLLPPTPAALRSGRWWSAWILIAALALLAALHAAWLALSPRIPPRPRAKAEPPPAAAPAAAPSRSAVV
jgi:hypothetical protein